MKTTLRVVTALLLFFSAAAVPAEAGELKLTIANGRATLIAQDVPVRQILSEWERLGGTKIINGDKLAGPPVTLQIVDKPEREVLETLLRSASGYVAAPRAAMTAGASVFEAVMIMPTSRPPAVTASAPPAFNQRPGFQPQPMPQPAMPVVEDDEDREVAEQGVVPPPGMAPQPGMMTQPGMMPQPGLAQPGVQPQVQPYPGMQQPGMQQPQQAPLTSPRPGVVPPPQAVPANPYQPQPQQPVRRPGGEGI